MNDLTRTKQAGTCINCEGTQCFWQLQLVLSSHQNYETKMMFGISEALILDWLGEYGVSLAEANPIVGHVGMILYSQTTLLTEGKLADCTHIMTIST